MKKFWETTNRQTKIGGGIFLAGFFLVLLYIISGESNWMGNWIEVGVWAGAVLMVIGAVSIGLNFGAKKNKA
jgi:hypothetical protein